MRSLSIFLLLGVVPFLALSSTVTNVRVVDYLENGLHVGWQYAKHATASKYGIRYRQYDESSAAWVMLITSTTSAHITALPMGGTYEIQVL